jgi:hypothetical protein
MRAMLIHRSQNVQTKIIEHDVGVLDFLEEFYTLFLFAEHNIVKNKRESKEKIVEVQS